MNPRYTSLLFPLLLLALLLGSRPAAAQFLWQRAVGTAPRNETAEFMVPAAGGFVTLGKYSALNTQLDQGVYLSKVNYFGDTLWTKRLALAGVTFVAPRGLIEDGAGNLVASLITSGSPPTPTAPPPPREGRLVKFTSTGDTIWTRSAQSPGNISGLLTLVRGNDGSYVVTGDLGTLPVLYKFSPAGALLWTRIVPYSNTLLGSLQNLVAVPNGYMVVSTPGAGLRSKYITVNEAGIYQFERLGYVNPPVQLRLDSQGSLLAIGGSLTKLTVQGDSIWSHSYQQYSALLALNRLVELPNGRYLAAGERANGPTRDVGLVVVDRNGTLLRDTLFVRNGDENVAGVALTPAGNYVVALGSAPGPLGGADQILFAYRNWDRLLPTRAAPPTALAALTAYPNPTADALTLETPDGHPLTGRWVLYDLLGRIVQTDPLPNQPRAHLTLASLPAGFYLLRVSDERNTTQTLRVEKN